VSFAAITLCVASQRVFIVVAAVYFISDSVHKPLDKHSHLFIQLNFVKCEYMES